MKTTNLRKRFAGAAGIAVISAASLAAITFAASPPAEAATVIKHKIKVSVPSSVTTYNGKKVTIKPKTTVGKGVNEKVTKTKIIVYKGKKKVASGAKVKLKVGTYKYKVTVTYSSWKYVTKTGRILKDPDGVAAGNDASNVTCKVTAVQSDDDFDFSNGSLTATCTSPNYPGQTLKIGYDDWCPIDLDWPYAVGQTTRANACYDLDNTNFKPYYASGPVKVKVSTGKHTFTTAKKKIKIVNGGHRKYFEGDETFYHVTASFKVPHTWKLYLGGFDFSDIGNPYADGCRVIGDVYQRTSGGWQLADDVQTGTGFGPSKTVKYHGAGTFRLLISTTCDNWYATVGWK